MPLRANPFPNEWKWPLTHRERIEELEGVLRDESWEPNFENIKAAIEYHKGFDLDTICDRDDVFFQHGRRLESLHEMTIGACWAEVGNSETYFFY